MTPAPAPAPLPAFMPPRPKRLPRPELTREQLFVFEQLLAQGLTPGAARRLVTTDHTKGTA